MAFSPISIQQDLTLDPVLFVTFADKDLMLQRIAFRTSRLYHWKLIRCEGEGLMLRKIFSFEGTAFSGKIHFINVNIIKQS